MQTSGANHETDHPPAPRAVPRKQALWQKVGGGSLSISVLIHLVLLVIGIFWVLQLIPEPEKVVDFAGNSGGGGSPSTDSKMKQHRVQMMQPNMARIAAQGAVSNLTLPEPDASSSMTSLGSISSGEMAGGLGGKGSGGGMGDGHGTGKGSGLAPGLSTGAGTKSPFGALNADKNALVGTFYDLKQTPDRKPTGMTDSRMREEFKEISRRGFRDNVFDKYFKAPRKLYQTKIYIPLMEANAAPAAFGVEKEVQPSMWIVVYRGSVIAPKTGKFRFVGLADDVLLVRLNNRAVFDFGHTIGGLGFDISTRKAELDGSVESPELAKEVRKQTPMRLPMTFYKYSNTPTHNRMIGGFAVGPEFDVIAGRSYPIDILVSEIPGAQFAVTLLIEEVGGVYEKDSAGFPILPLFRLDQSLPEIRSEAAPFDPAGPVWKFSASGKNLDI